MDQVAGARDEAAGADNTELAPAKINLALHLGAERADGYYALQSLVVFADVADAVSARPAEDASAITLDLSGPYADLLEETTTGSDNLVLRAAQAIAARAPSHAGPVHLCLDKRIPVAAGLSGGSADAAATLRLLNRVWDLRLGPETLSEIGVALGADVPMCLASRPLVASGIGERLTPIARMPTLAVVLANPGIVMPTRAVFAGLGKEERTPLPALPPTFKSTLDLVHWLRKTRNDLVDPARVVSRKAVAAAEVLASDPDCAFARMTGSGATVFGLFMTQAAAERAARRLRAAQPDWWVTAATTGGS